MYKNTNNLLLRIAIIVSINLIAMNSIYSQSIPFKKFTVNDGLSNNVVSCLLQDKNGFMWFGTDDGLNRFDGYSFKVYRNNPEKMNTISSNSIWSLFEDADGYLWIGTKSGELNRYDPYYDKFTSWSVDSKSINGQGITAIYKSNDEIWIGTYRNGLYKFNIKTKEFKNWTHQPDNSKSISNNFITSIVEDNSGNLWISTYNGLNKLNPNNTNDVFTRFYSEDNNQSLSNDLIWSLSISKIDSKYMWICTAGGLSKYDFNNETFARYDFLDKTDSQFGNSVSSITEEIVNGDNILWIGTYAGILRMNLSDKKAERFTYTENNINGLVSNQVNRISRDRSGVIWLATEDGINYYSNKNAKFSYTFYFNKSYNLEQISTKNIKSICQSTDGTIWFGNPNGLYSLKNVKGVKKVERFNNSNKLNVWTITAGNSNDIWIGTYGQGLKQLDIKTGNIKSYNIENATDKASPYNYIKSLYLDKNGYLWIGFWGGGLAKLNPLTGEYINWRNDLNDPKSLSYNDVWAIKQDKYGRIWIGTNGGGLNLFLEIDGGTFYHFNDEIMKIKSSGTLSINCIQESNVNDSDGTILWIGTTDGLIKMQIEKSQKVNDYSHLVIKTSQKTIKDGLANNIIKSILKDNDGNLWLGTNSGLTFFNVQSNTLTNYNESDGIIGNEINISSALKAKTNLMFFGSASGIILFNPSQIYKSDYKPNVIFTDFQIFNENIKAGEESPLKENITYAKQIRLSYSQNVFSLQFASLDYNSPGTIKYAYKMEGFDNDWIVSYKRRFVTYTNLNSGEYTFKVKATNSDGVWLDNEASISIVITPPWWRTVWAYILYGLIIVLGLYLIRRTEMNRTKLRDELRLQEIETEKFKDVEKIKSRFFANLSHEFRTPLMLIKGPVEQLLSGRKINQLELIKLIDKNSQKLQNLIDQLLELTQLESDSILLKAKKVNQVPVVRGIFHSFSSLAEQKNISIQFNSTDDKIFAWIDRDKFEKILNNLLSNAFKFTSENGNISVSISTDKIAGNEVAFVSIKDTGIGIPKDNIDKIFDRFYQIDDSSRRVYSGSGIGLSLVRELVDLHKWKINVTSELGVGTEFILQIPLDDNYLNENQKVKDDIQARDTKFEMNEEHQPVVEEILSSKSVQTKSEDTLYVKKNLDRLSILIVEDSEDVRIYLNEILKDNYNIIMAENGEKGLLTVMENLPDLIISDVMMPRMNGIEFCKKIKSDWKTSHIPVILLTAKASSESKIEGLETGADDYITKPFSFQELSVRIKNLLEQRKLLRDKFAKDVNFRPENITPNKADQEFLEKAISIVDKNISVTEFGSEKLAAEIFLSRSQLHRKIRSITDQSTGEFIRTIRLKKASGLILEKTFSVTQIAFEVGFNSPSHFTKAFKQMFGCLPSEFINRSNT